MFKYIKSSRFIVQYYLTEKDFDFAQFDHHPERSRRAFASPFVEDLTKQNEIDLSFRFN